MTVEERARELHEQFYECDSSHSVLAYIEDSINKAILEEREACAKICDEFSTKGVPDYAIKTRIAQAIRGRNNVSQ